MLANAALFVFGTYNAPALQSGLCIGNLVASLALRSEWLRWA
jgi:hypothetical protein